MRKRLSDESPMDLASQMAGTFQKLAGISGPASISQQMSESVRLGTLGSLGSTLQMLESLQAAHRTLSSPDSMLGQLREVTESLRRSVCERGSALTQTLDAMRQLQRALVRPSVIAEGMQESMAVVRHEMERPGSLLLELTRTPLPDGTMVSPIATGQGAMSGFAIPPAEVLGNLGNAASAIASAMEAFPRPLDRDVVASLKSASEMASKIASVPADAYPQDCVVAPDLSISYGDQLLTTDEMEQILEDEIGPRALQRVNALRGAAGDEGIEGVGTAVQRTNELVQEVLARTLRIEAKQDGKQDAVASVPAKDKYATTKKFVLAVLALIVGNVIWHLLMAVWGGAVSGRSTSAPRLDETRHDTPGAASDPCDGLPPDAPGAERVDGSDGDEAEPEGSDGSAGSDSTTK